MVTGERQDGAGKILGDEFSEYGRRECASGVLEEVSCSLRRILGVVGFFWGTWC